LRLRHKVVNGMMILYCEPDEATPTDWNVHTKVDDHCILHDEVLIHQNDRSEKELAEMINATARTITVQAQTEATHDMRPESAHRHNPGQHSPFAKWKNRGSKWKKKRNRGKK